MKRSSIIQIVSGAMLCAGLCAAPMTANAATAAEAAEIARQYGYSEDLIQQGWNEYNAHPELYPPEVIDSYIEILKQSGNTIVTNVPYDPDAQVPSTTTAVPAPDNQNNNNNDNKQDDKPSDETPSQPDDGRITLEMPDGTTFERISREQFISYSYEDKMTYLSTLTPEQQTVFIKNLSPEEYKSLLKQLPADQKLSIINDVTSITDSLGFILNVDEITDENIIVSMKNQDGEIVAVGAAKDVVEDTGYDRRALLAVVGALVTAGTAGMFLIVKKCFGKDDIET